MSASDDEPGVSERRRYKPDETRERVLAAAERLFAEKGYVAASTADIAAAAGVAEGSIFYHFGTKRGLLVALGERFGHAMVLAMRGNARSPGELEPGIMVMRAFEYGDRCGALGTQIGLAPDDPAAQPLMAAARAVVVAFIEQVMRARPPELAPPGWHIPSAASLSYAAVHDAMERLVMDDEQTDRAVVMAECIRFIRAACGYGQGGQP